MRPGGQIPVSALQDGVIFHEQMTLLPLPTPSAHPQCPAPVSPMDGRTDGWTHRQMGCSRPEVFPQTDALLQENNEVSGWKEGCPACCLHSEVARCSAKAVAWCQFIVPCTESLPGDELQRKPEVAGALEGSKRSLVEGFGKSCLTNLFFYV